MKPTTHLAMAALTAQAAAQLTVIDPIMADVNSQILDLAAKVGAFSASDESTVTAIGAANSALVATLDAGITTIEGSEDLVQNDVLSLTSGVSALQTSSGYLLGNLTAIHDAVEQARDCELFRDQTGLLIPAGGGLIDAVVAKAPTDLQDLARTIAGQITIALTEGGYLFAEGNCTNAALPESTTALPVTDSPTATGYPTTGVDVTATSEPVTDSLTATGYPTTGVDVTATSEPVTDSLTATGYSTDYPDTTELTTSTVCTTITRTITSCAPTVTKCPAHSTVIVTETIPLYTTVCPVSETPAETYPPASSPAETYPAESSPVETAPASTYPVESSPVETAPASTYPAESSPVETAPASTYPAETSPVETSPVETYPAESSPVETAPGSSAPVETAPAQTGIVTYTTPATVPSATTAPAAVVTAGAAGLSAVAPAGLLAMIGAALML